MGRASRQKEKAKHNNFINNNFTLPKDDKLSKSNLYKIVSSLDVKNKTLIEAVNNDRMYRMPMGYISWATLVRVVAISLKTCCYSKDVDSMMWTNSYRTALWFAHNSPLYCLTTELGNAFENTDCLSKTNAMAGWQPSLPSFLVALPENLIHTPDGAAVDYLVVSCYDSEHPEWDSYKWKTMSVKAYHNPANLAKRYFQVCTLDSTGIGWNVATDVDMFGHVTDYTCSLYNDSALLLPPDLIFLNKLKNLAANLLLTIQFSPFLLADIQEQEVNSAKGFEKNYFKSRTNKIQNAVNRYPRWLGKNYLPKTSQIPDSKVTNTHASPRTHWRRGHWRCIEPGDGKQWKESKRLWIEPVLINAGVE